MEKLINIDKKIYHEYSVENELECGIVLLGNETKAIKLRKCNLKSGRVFIKNNEIFINGLSIIHERIGVNSNQKEYKLLIHKKEKREIAKWLEEKGKTIVPIKTIIDNNGRIKIIIGFCVGLKNYDKREKEKEKDTKRTIDKAMKAMKGI